MAKKSKNKSNNPKQLDRLTEVNNDSKNVESAETKDGLPDDTKAAVVNDAVNSAEEGGISAKDVDDTVKEPDVVPADASAEDTVEPVEAGEQASCENSEASSDQGSSKNDDNEALNKDTESSCENSDAQSDETAEHSETVAEAPTMPEATNETVCEQSEDATEAVETERKTDENSDEAADNSDSTDKETEAVDYGAKLEKAVDHASRRNKILFANIVALCVVFGIIYALWASSKDVNKPDDAVDNPNSQTEFIPTEPDGENGTAGEITSGTIIDDSNTSGSGETSTSGSDDAADSSVKVTDTRFFGDGKVVEDTTNYHGKYVASDVGDYVDIGFYVDASGALVNSDTNETKTEQDLDGAYAANNGYLTVDNVWFGNDDIGKPGAKTLYCDGNTKISIAKFTNNSNKDGTITLYVGSNSEVGSIRVYDIYVNSELCQYSRDVSYSNSKVDFVTVNWENVYYSGNNNLCSFTISVVVVGADGSTLAKIDNVSITDYIK